MREDGMTQRCHIEQIKERQNEEESLNQSVDENQDNQGNEMGESSCTETAESVVTRPKRVRNPPDRMGAVPYY